MNRNDIETFGIIKSQLYEYGSKILSTMATDRIVVGINEFTKVIGVDVVGDYLQLVYSSYLGDRSLFIPLQYVEAEDIHGFCIYYSGIIKKYGKEVTESELEELVYKKHWDVFYKLFYIPFPPESPKDLDRASSKLHGLINTMTIILKMSRTNNGNETCIAGFTEKDLFLYSSVLIQFLDWVRADDYWSTRKNSEVKGLDKLKADFINGQEEIIKLIKESSRYSQAELSLARKALEDIKTL